MILKPCSRLVNTIKTATALLDAVGKRVIIIVADASKYLNGEMPTAEPDQQSLDGIDSVEVYDHTPVADSCPATAVDA